MSLDMHLRAAAFISVCVFSASAQAQQGESAPPLRVVSVDLCADAYVMSLAGHNTIAALSWQAGDPVSGVTGPALDLPRAGPDVEAIIGLEADIVLYGPGGPGRAAPILETAGIEALTLEWGEDFAVIRRNMRHVGDALTTRPIADDFIAEMDARLAALESRTVARSAQPAVFYLSASGGTAGTGTLVDAAIQAAGGRNAAAEAGAQSWVPANPEWAFRIEPDLVVTSYFRDGYNSINNTGIRHSSFRDVLRHTPRVDVASSAWSCAGPRLILAAETIADALDGLAAE